MMKLVLPALTMFFILFIPLFAYSSVPFTKIQSCVIDLNKDNATDVALLIDDGNVGELIILVKSKPNYTIFTLSKRFVGMQLACQSGQVIQETVAGSGKKSTKTHQTNGAYIQLFQNEGGVVDFYWNGVDFTEVWESD